MSKVSQKRSSPTLLVASFGIRFFNLHLYAALSTRLNLLGFTWFSQNKQREPTSELSFPIGFGILLYFLLYFIEIKILVFFLCEVGDKRI